MKNRSKEKFVRRNLIASVILATFVAIILTIYNFFLINTEKESCYNILVDTTAEASSKIENNFKNDKASLRMLAKIISNESDLTSTSVTNQLTTYAVNSYITNIAILTPDNTIIQPRHRNISNISSVSYNTEIQLGEHVSGQQPSTFQKNTYVIRNYVPIKAGIGAKGLLFTEIDPIALANAWNPEIYDGQATFCIVNKNTGDIIISSNTDLQNHIYEVIDEQLASNITNGETGYSNIKINNNSYLIAYRSMTIEQWEILFIIDEDIAMNSANIVKHYLSIFLIIIGVIFMLFLTYMTRNTFKVIAETKRDANIDALTGLENRNNYEMYRMKATHISKIICVYIDVNGLHTINNEKGHLAGDLMLKYVAETLKKYFSEDSHIYRIGGDEFVIFNKTEIHQVTNRMKLAFDDIVRNNYNISYGIYQGTDEMNISDVAKEAESLMYDMKKKYYESIGQPMRNVL